MDYYLKADSEQSLWNALVSAGAAKQVVTKDESGAVVSTSYVPEPGYSLDVIGTVYKATGNMVQQTVDGVTTTVPEMTALPGYHANLRGPADLAPQVTYVAYQPTTSEQQDPNFVLPPPTVTTTPSVLEPLLVYPKTPTRVWF